MCVVAACAGDTGRVCTLAHAWACEEGTMKGSAAHLSLGSCGLWAWGRHLGQGVPSGYDPGSGGVCADSLVSGNRPSPCTPVQENPSYKGDASDPKAAGQVRSRGRRRPLGLGAGGEVEGSGVGTGGKAKEPRK